MNRLCRRRPGAHAGLGKMPMVQEQVQGGEDDDGYKCTADDVRAKRK